MKKYCKNCGREFECYDKPRGSQHKRVKRSSNSVTCSKKCSASWKRKRQTKEFKKKTGISP